MEELRRRLKALGGHPMSGITTANISKKYGPNVSSARKTDKALCVTTNAKGHGVLRKTVWEGVGGARCSVQVLTGEASWSGAQ